MFLKTFRKSLDFQLANDFWKFAQDTKAHFRFLEIYSRNTE